MAFSSSRDRSRSRDRSPSPSSHLSRASKPAVKDWLCGQCTNWNLDWRSKCNRCETPRSTDAPRAGEGNKGCQYCGVQINPKRRLKHEPQCSLNPRWKAQEQGEQEPAPAPTRPKMMVPPQVLQRHPFYYMGRREEEKQQKSQPAAEAASRLLGQPRGLNTTECTCPRTGIDLCQVHAKVYGRTPGSTQPNWWELGAPRNPHHDPGQVLQTRPERRSDDGEREDRRGAERRDDRCGAERRDDRRGAERDSRRGAERDNRRGAERDDRRSSKEQVSPADARPLHKILDQLRFDLGVTGNATDIVAIAAKELGVAIDGLGLKAAANACLNAMTG